MSVREDVIYTYSEFPYPEVKVLRFPK